MQFEELNGLWAFRKFCLFFLKTNWWIGPMWMDGWMDAYEENTLSVSTRGHLTCFICRKGGGRSEKMFIPMTELLAERIPSC